jgi:hypothetical protein
MIFRVLNLSASTAEVIIFVPHIYKVLYLKAEKVKKKLLIKQKSNILWEDQETTVVVQRQFEEHKE